IGLSVWRYRDDRTVLVSCHGWIGRLDDAACEKNRRTDPSPEWGRAGASCASQGGCPGSREAAGGRKSAGAFGREAWFDEAFAVQGAQRPRCRGVFAKTGEKTQRAQAENRAPFPG